MKKQRIFISFPTQQHMPPFDQPFRNDIKKTNSAVRFTKFYVFSKLLFNHRELEKTFNMWKERFCSSFPTPYYMPHSDKQFKNAIENTIHVFCAKKNGFKTVFKPLIFCQKFKLGHDIGVHSFPMIYSKPYLGNIAGSSTQFTEKVRRVTQAVQVVIRILF